MEKRIRKAAGHLSVLLGSILAVYVGIWRMLIRPLAGLYLTYRAGELTIFYVVVTIVKCWLSLTVGSKAVQRLCISRHGSCFRDWRTERRHEENLSIYRVWRHAGNYVLHRALYTGTGRSQAESVKCSRVCRRKDDAGSDRDYKEREMVDK